MNQKPFNSWKMLEVETETLGRLDIFHRRLELFANTELFAPSVPRSDMVDRPPPRSVRTTSTPDPPTIGASPAVRAAAVGEGAPGHLCADELPGLKKDSHQLGAWAWKEEHCSQCPRTPGNLEVLRLKNQSR